MRTNGFSTIALGFPALLLLPGCPDAAPAYSAWSAPVNLGPVINTSSADAGAALSSDGLTLYFNSTRAGGLGSNDIWVARRANVDAQWGTPQNLGAIVNTAGMELAPALSRDEHWIFINSDRTGGFGHNDLWMSYRAHTHEPFGWEAPVNLGASVNSAAFDTAASFFENDHAGAPMLFFASTRPGGLGSFDIYASIEARPGTFGPATRVSELNSPGNDGRPAIRVEVSRCSSTPTATIWPPVADSTSSSRPARIRHSHGRYRSAWAQS